MSQSDHALLYSASGHPSSPTLSVPCRRLKTPPCPLHAPSTHYRFYFLVFTGTLFPLLAPSTPPLPSYQPTLLAALSHGMLSREGLLAASDAMHGGAGHCGYVAPEDRWGTHGWKGRAQGTGGGRDLGGESVLWAPSKGLQGCGAHVICGAGGQVGAGEGGGRGAGLRADLKLDGGEGSMGMQRREAGNTWHRRVGRPQRVGPGLTVA